MEQRYASCSLLSLIAGGVFVAAVCCSNGLDLPPPITEPNSCIVCAHPEYSFATFDVFLCYGLMKPSIERLKAVWCLLLGAGCACAEIGVLSRCGLMKSSVSRRSTVLLLEP